MQKLNLYKNNLSGEIPSSLGQCVAMQDLQLFDNKLSGEIPSSLGQCVAMENLRLATTTCFTARCPPSPSPT